MKPDSQPFLQFAICGSILPWTILVFDPLGVKIHEESCLTASGALERTIDLRPVPPGI